MTTKTFLIAVVSQVLMASAMAADWPQWQGVNRDAVSTETGLKQEWSADGPALVWRIDDLGGGYSAPAISAGHLYGLSNRGESEVVWCLSEKDGGQVWAKTLGPAVKEGMRQGIEGPGGTPTIDGDRLYVIGAGGIVACLRTSDGEVVWQRNMVTDFGGRLPTWRYSESPLVDGDKLLCTPGGEDATVVLLNKLTGDEIWKTKVPDGKPTSTSNRGGSRRSRSSFDWDPVLQALDADSNKELSTSEISSASKSLAALDKDGDGKLTEEEVAPSFGNRGGGRRRGGRNGGMMRMMPVSKALDADENGEVSDTEIAMAATVLKALDKDEDGKLTDGEVSPSFGSRGPASSAAYSSAIAIDVGGRRQYVQYLATTLVGLDAETGSVLWRYDKAANANRINCSTPIYHDGIVFAASAYGNGGGAVKLEFDGESYQANEVYFTSNMQNHHGGMIIHEGCLYGANGGNGGGFLACLDFSSGKVLWRDRDAQKGSLAFADNRLYLRTEDGALILIEPNAKEFVERGRFQQPDRTESPAWTHPVIANGKLYVRDQSLLLCYDVAKGT